MNEQHIRFTRNRREFLRDAFCGFGSLAFTSMLAEEQLRAAGTNPLAAKSPPLPPRPPLGTTPTVAVVIPCHDYGRFLADAVASVANQTWRPLQCVVVDDGSTDDSARTAHDLVRRHPDLDLRVLVQRNAGVGAARNAGVRATTAPLVMQLDADDRLQAQAVARLVQPFLADPHLDVAHCDAREYGASEAPLPAAPRVTLEALKRGNALNYCALVRRSTWDHVGGYRCVRRGYDDWDLWLALAAAGARFAHVPEQLLRYHRHGTNMTERDRARARASRAQIALARPDLFTARELRRAHATYEHCGVDGTLLTARRALELLLERRPRRALRTLLGR